MFPTRSRSFHLGLFLSAALLCGAGACSESPSDDPPPPPPADMAEPLIGPRLTRDINMEIHDKKLNDEICEYKMQTGTCEMRCFPKEPFFKGCGDDLLVYWYTRQGLAKVLTFGTEVTRMDAACAGATTYKLVAVMAKKPAKATNCDTGMDISPSLPDRNWYRTGPTAVDPATVSELPLN